MSIDELGQAIANHPGRVQVAFCGFDLWWAVFASGHVGMTEFRAGGQIATGQESDNALKIPIPTVGNPPIVISFDPTLPPDGYRLAP